MHVDISSLKSPDDFCLFWIPIREFLNFDVKHLLARLSSDIDLNAVTDDSCRHAPHYAATLDFFVCVRVRIGQNSFMANLRLFGYVVTTNMRLSCSTFFKMASILSITDQPERGSSLTSKLPD
ncbi:hypothetical protein EVAR_777_1 [Eumeta japonica]|uniref:Uncharacterized protein n=1 Tax=Eumeta variegata TaxID=151549 RepID=A0A4C1SBX4_EUMVA|nr:hypothetical protein EVAR_777_1 [Eumeta japonica]